MAAIRRVLLSDVLPLLLVCALVSLVVALIELLLVLASCCFADHVKKIKDLKSKARSRPHPRLGLCNVLQGDWWSWSHSIPKGCPICENYVTLLPAATIFCLASLELHLPG